MPHREVIQFWSQTVLVVVTLKVLFWLVDEGYVQAQIFGTKNHE